VRVWVTRDETDDGPLCTALRAHNLSPVLEPVVERRVVADPAGILGTLGPDDWLVLTSPYAIQAADCDAARVPRVAVVAEPSRRLAESLGLRVALVSSGGDGKSLFAELREKVTSGKVCYPRSSKAKVPESWPGIELHSPVLYETVARDFARTVIGRVDVVTVASPSAVNAIGKLELPFASIGSVTSAALRKIGVEPWLESPEPSLESLAAAIAARAD
jgi:uroporphyrinogen-III synthase